MFAEKVKIFVKKVCLQLSGTCSFYEVYPRLKTNTTWIKSNSNNKNNNNKNWYNDDRSKVRTNGIHPTLLDIIQET